MIFQIDEKISRVEFELTWIVGNTTKYQAALTTDS